jgi:hypothetical protein
VNHQPTDREEKALCSTSSLHVSEESDHAIVPVNLSNNGEPSPAEIGEGSAGTKENAGPPSTPDTERGSCVPGIGRRASSIEGTKTGEVHGFAPPSHARPAT